MVKKVRSTDVCTPYLDYTFVPDSGTAATSSCQSLVHRIMYMCKLQSFHVHCYATICTTAAFRFNSGVLGESVEAPQPALL